jgi:CheY-like chemotaxis protein
MTIDLLSLRALVVSPDEGLRDLFRHAAASLSIPVEIVDVASATECRSAAGVGADLAYLDAALHLEELARATAALRAAGKPPFTVQLAASASTQSFATDGLAGRPSRFEEAKWLLERSMRVRLPSHVLIVDDSATMRSIVRKTLASTRFPLEVSEADEGFTALKLVREAEFHIVFLDYNMPDFSGLETLAEFKREQRRVNVVMMTSTPSAERRASRSRPLFGRGVSQEAVFSRGYRGRAVELLRPARAQSKTSLRAAWLLA